MEEIKLVFRDGELPMEPEYTRYSLIKNCISDGYKAVYLDRFDTQNFLDLVRGNYQVETINIAEFLMPPEEELINIFRTVADSVDYRVSEQLVRDSEFLKK